jgi:lipopolysaccharide transport system ATP-binding protein
MDSEVLIGAEGASKKFCRSLKKSLWYGVKDIGAEVLGASGARQRLRAGEFWAVDDVSFEVRRGECLGVVGRNGAGKTTLLRLLNGLIRPDKGQITMRGRVGALIALGAGFNPILTGRENIYVNGAVLGLSKREITARLDDIVDFADLGEFIDTPVQYYSSGMHVRLGFAVATSLSPDILLLDEVLAVGDTAFRGKCFKRIGEIISSTAVVFISHNEAQVLRICNRAIVLESGRPSFYGDTAEALRLYQAQQIERSPSTQIVKDANVVAFEVLRVSGAIAWDGRLELEVRIETARELAVGYVLVHLARNGEFVANSEWRGGEKDRLLLVEGTQTLSFVIEPIHLVRGRYSLSLSIFDASCKKTVLQAFDFATVDVAGSLGSGPANLLPMKMTVRGAAVDSLVGK